MKRSMIICIFVFIILAVTGHMALANENKYPSNILNVYKSEDGYISAGIKRHYMDAIYFGGNIEYKKDSGVDLELNAIYLIPEIFIFDVYGGVGLNGNFVNKELDPYLLLGGHFIFFFSETMYYITEERVETRSGLKFEF